MKTNKKLALNKKIVASLDAQSMGAVKGGAILTLQKYCREVTETIIITIQYTFEHCFSTDKEDGICHSDLCSIFCQSNGCGGGTQEYASCYGGSCGKCG